MDPLSLFPLALGLPAPWEVVDVAFNPKSGRIDCHLAFASGTRFACPHYCGAEHQPVHDTLERDWRHLNFFQFQAYSHTKVPRVRCNSCAKTTQVGVPWARPNSGFSLLMEALLVILYKAMTVFQVTQLLGVSDGRIWRTLDHYVDQAHRSSTDGTAGRAIAAWSRSRRWPRYSRITGQVSSMRSMPGSPTAVSRRSIRSSRPPKPRPAATGPPGT